MRLPTTPATMARWSWAATILMTPFVQVGLWLLLSPGGHEGARDILGLLQAQAIAASWFGIIAAMLGTLLWPVTRRVITATNNRPWKTLIRCLYAAGIGLACGLFIAYHLSILSPDLVPFRPPTQYLHVLVPPVATGLIWAVWYAMLEALARRRTSGPA